MKTKKIALYGIMTALALILSYVEAQIPALMAVPGMKIGLTNLVVVTALFKVDEKGALLINFVRILAVGLLFGTALSLSFSLAGGFLSYAVMLLLKKSGKFGIMAISATGGVFHNIGQILTAMVLLNTKAILSYLPILWITGIVSGLIIGFISGLICERIPDSIVS